MAKRILFIWMWASLLVPFVGRAAEPVPAKADSTSQDDGYIMASLLVADPASEVYSLFGHCALRLQCPSQRMDYCFTFETAADTRGIVRFLDGTAFGGFMASQTADYLSAFRQAGRGITEYRLNLTPREKVSLWQTVDEEIVHGCSRRYGYMHTQCTSMCIYLVNRALGTRIQYHDLPQDFQDCSFRQLMLQAGKTYPWSGFFWQTVMGPAGDDTEPLAHKLTPQLLPEAWQKATVGNEARHLIDTDGVRIVEASEKVNSTSWFSPVVVFALLLVFVVGITIGERLLHWRILPRTADALLLALHTLVSLALLWLVLFSSQEATEWNWYLIVFNPLPLLLWLIKRSWRPRIAAVFVAVMAVFVLLTPFIPQLDWPHALIVCALAVRLLSKNSKNHIFITLQK